MSSTKTEPDVDYWRSRVEEDEMAVAELEAEPLDDPAFHEEVLAGNRLLLDSSRAKLAEAEALAG